MKNVYCSVCAKSETSLGVIMEGDWLGLGGVLTGEAETCTMSMRYLPASSGGRFDAGEAIDRRMMTEHNLDGRISLTLL